MIFIAGLSAVVSLALWIPGKSSAAIIVYAVIFGFSSGGFISLSPALIAQISDVRQIGIRTGIAYAVQSFGGLTGSPIAGAITSSQNGAFLGLQIFCGVVMSVSVVIYLFARTTQVGLKLAVKV